MLDVVPFSRLNSFCITFKNVFKIRIDYSPCVNRYFLMPKSKCQGNSPSAVRQTEKRKDYAQIFNRIKQKGRRTLAQPSKASIPHALFTCHAYLSWFPFMFQFIVCGPPKSGAQLLFALAGLIKFAMHATLAYEIQLTNCRNGTERIGYRKEQGERTRTHKRIFAI